MRGSILAKPRATPLGPAAHVRRASQPEGWVKIADRLAADGLLERRPGADHRTVALHLTAKGRSAAASVLSRRAGELTDLLSGLEPAEREALEPLLEKLVAGLAHDRPAAVAVCRLCDRAVCCGGVRGCPMQHIPR